jgi:hypothetical protein
VSLSDDDEEEVKEVVADKRDRWLMQRVNDWLQPWVNYLPKRIKTIILNWKYFGSPKIY